MLPGVVYGHGFPIRHVAVAPGPLLKLLSAAGSSTLVDLKIDDAPPVKVLISDVQHDTRTGDPLHVDFHQVSLTEKVSAEISLAVTGESPAVKEQGGILVRTLDHVRVEGLPGDLVAEIPVDISGLVTFANKILVKDLVAPKGLTILDAPDEVVALVEPPRSEEELAALEEKVEEKVEDVGVVEKPKAVEGVEAAAEGQPASEGKETKKEPKSEKS
jgi:large subunit ribosomal protein L25